VSYPELLAAWPVLVAGSLVLVGLIVGSFLNVVILRLPVMLKQQWQADCRELLAGIDASAESDGGAPRESEQLRPGIEATDSGPAQGTSPPESRLSLSYPGSRCPGCHTPIKPWHNIPVVSYLMLRGRCAACKRPIGLRYPAVEILGAVVAVCAGVYAGGWAQLGAYLLVGWSLLLLSGIDIDEQLLPDDITLPLLWAGLLYHLATGELPLADAVLGATFGYLLLWSIYWLFRIVTGKEGMGYGDFKLLAALGAWMGWQSLPLIILLSAGAGAVIGIALIVLRGRDRAQPMPFGPYLAIAGWIALLWGDAIASAYLGAAGL
jgi:leader peptidase (prepilin peptidase)/N-methyltransferase